jgi:hypothetical protein
VGGRYPTRQRLLQPEAAGTAWVGNGPGRSGHWRSPAKSSTSPVQGARSARARIESRRGDARPIPALVTSTGCSTTEPRFGCRRPNGRIRGKAARGERTKNAPEAILARWRSGEGHDTSLNARTHHGARLVTPKPYSKLFTLWPYRGCV